MGNKAAREIQKNLDLTSPGVYRKDMIDNVEKKRFNEIYQKVKVLKIFHRDRGFK